MSFAIYAEDKTTLQDRRRSRGGRSRGKTLHARLNRIVR